MFIKTQHLQSCNPNNFFFQFFSIEEREEFLELKLVFWPKSLKIIGLSKARVLYDGYGHIHSPKNVGMQS